VGNDAIPSINGGISLMIEEITVRRVLVRGRVQGVGYRAWVAESAVARGLAGWVRNRRDGSVEAVFAGPAARVTAMMDACEQGPLMARVASVSSEEASTSDLDLRYSGQRFSVLPTA
jgi:acylphosphatase